MSRSKESAGPRQWSWDQLLHLQVLPGLTVSRRQGLRSGLCEAWRSTGSRECTRLLAGTQAWRRTTAPGFHADLPLPSLSLLPSWVFWVWFQEGISSLQESVAF